MRAKTRQLLVVALVCGVLAAPAVAQTLTPSAPIGGETTRDLTGGQPRSLVGEKFNGFRGMSLTSGIGGGVLIVGAVLYLLARRRKG